MHQPLLPHMSVHAPLCHLVGSVPAIPSQELNEAVGFLKVSCAMDSCMDEWMDGQMDVWMA